MYRNSGSRYIKFNLKLSEYPPESGKAKLFVLWKFGKIETMKIKVDNEGRFAIWNNGRQLTNVPFKK